jgi:peroxiredoxin Q/BCP
MGIGRATFLVDPEGHVARVWPKVSVDGHAAEVLTVLRAAAAGR